MRRGRLFGALPRTLEKLPEGEPPTLIAFPSTEQVYLLKDAAS